MKEDIYILTDYNDDYCGSCYRETDYSNTFCCTLCWKLICPNCVKIFEEGKLYPSPLGYTICKKNCFIIHKILNKLFNESIALYISSFNPYNLRKNLYNNFNY